MAPGVEPAVRLLENRFPSLSLCYATLELGLVLLLDAFSIS